MGAIPIGRYLFLGLVLAFLLNGFSIWWTNVSPNCERTMLLWRNGAFFVMSSSLWGCLVSYLYLTTCIHWSRLNEVDVMILTLGFWVKLRHEACYHQRSVLAFKHKQVPTIPIDFHILGIGISYCPNFLGKKRYKNIKIQIIEKVLKCRYKKWASIFYLEI
jgi:hypothetical protein